MVKELGDSEKEFLINKYRSMGLSNKKAEVRLSRLLKLMVVSPAIVLI